ncbi:MAG: group II intron reverse transcriptase/maturase [Clostridiaceae bacterium]|nr:group II intron reverse transcriptase/maturase [Clostridiaceae bacterium]
MRNPKLVLDSLTREALKIESECHYERLYRNLYNVEFYHMAYNNIYAREGNMTEGTDGKTIDGMGEDRINKLIESIKNQTYQPNPAKRTYIPKKNSEKKRPLGIPSTDDKLVQEIVRNILESIYEVRFSDNSHGFRPKRSCHTALTQIARQNGVKWYIEGDIKGFFDNIDHHVLINILRRKIKDEKFINLIWKFLRAGYLEDWKFNNTYSGTPQGGIVSPILANIYLHEFDKYMSKYITEFNIGIKGKQVNPEYKYIQSQIQKRRKWLENNKMCENRKWLELNEGSKNNLYEEIKELKKKLTSIPYTKEMDDSFKRMTYTRYADDFLIGVIGSKEDCVKVKNNIGNYLKNELKLELSQEKTLITHSKNFIRFLGYDITVSKSQETKTISNRNYGKFTRRNSSGKVMLYVPHEVWVNKLKQYDALKIEMIDGKEIWKACHRTYLKDNDDLEIFSQYNAEIRGLYNYYRLANNVSVLNKFYYIMRYSFAKTLGNKYKISIRKIMCKFNINGNLGIKYETKSGTKIRYFYKDGFYRNTSITNKTDIDIEANTAKYCGRTSLIDRLKAHQCEWCGKEDVEIEIHHVKKLKNLKGKKAWERLMISRKRKTLALCLKCHVDLHNGKLD